MYLIRESYYSRQKLGNMYIIHELKNSHDEIGDRVLQQGCNVVISQRFVILLSMKLSAKEIPRMQPPPHVKAMSHALIHRGIK